MIHVCDAIMGSGKSRSAITFMNEHKERRFIYITPYVDEAGRIAKECSDRHFDEPSTKFEEYDFSKIQHTKQLIHEGRNVATTHSAFKLYTPDMVEDLKRWKYTLIVDESVNIFTDASFHPTDIELFEKAGYIRKKEDGQYELIRDDYDGTAMREMFIMFKRNALINVAADTDDSPTMFYWCLDSTILRSFVDVYVLTYLFKGQDMQIYLDINGLEYDYIGIEKNGDRYSFCDTMKYVPEYTHHLSDMIEIHDSKKHNKIGEGKNALSKSWFKRASEETLDDLKSHLIGFFRTKHHAKAPNILWTTFDGFYERIGGRGFKECHAPCNCCATNDFKDRHYLAYCVNLFAHPDKKNKMNALNCGYDETVFAKTTMIQWIWRSAIRKGEKVYIYVPSSRMRKILVDWIAETEAMANAIDSAEVVPYEV